MRKNRPSQPTSPQEANTDQASKMDHTPLTINEPDVRSKQRLPRGRTKDEEAGPHAPTRQFAHPSAMMVLTARGKIARYFPGIEYPPRDVRLALIAASHNQIGSLADRVFLLCFHYNPQTGRYGLLIMHVMQFAGIGTALAVGAYIVLNVLRERRLAF